MSDITAEILCGWLTEGRPVTILDVRGQDDRAQWWIPGSLHMNAYEALRQGRTDALAKLEIAATGPIVTVCNRGKVSQVAAEQLRARGMDACSLVGGMHAWSLAWNVAEVPLSTPGAQLLQIRRTGKGCLSYMLGSEGSAAVLDASLDPAIYVRLAEARGWQIRWVFDSHVHADHLSRSKKLAELCGAQLLLPAQQRVRFAFHALSDGDRLPVGLMSLSALRTPGHTGESTCFLLDDECLLTGDTLFLGSVGRPDLRADAAEARKRVSWLYDSLRRLRSLPPHLLVLPGHANAPVPFDGRPITAPLGQVLSGLDAWVTSEQALADRLLAGLPPTPGNYERIVELNERGVFPAEDIAELEAGANRCAAG